MVTREIQIEGMSCGHCIISVKKELEKLDTVKVEDVQIGAAKISYDDSRLTSENIKEAIEEAGYKIKA